MWGYSGAEEKDSIGEMYIIQDDSFSVDITVADTYEPLSGFHEGQKINIDANGVSGEFVVLVPGIYKFDGIASLFPSAGMIVHFAVFVNGVVAENIESGIDFKNSQDTQTFSGTGILNLNKGDIITVHGKSDTVPVSVNVNHMNINLILI